MTREKIKEMLAELVQQLDQDLHKAYFECPEEPELAENMVEDLILIVEESLGQ